MADKSLNNSSNNVTKHKVYKTFGCCHVVSLSIGFVFICSLSFIESSDCQQPTDDKGIAKQHWPNKICALLEMRFNKMKVLGGNTSSESFLDNTLVICRKINFDFLSV